jgi:hypothetical protein
VAGAVRDSLAGGALAGATVQLVPQAAPSSPGLVVTTDSAGRYRLAGVAPGRYLLGVVHARLDSLGFELPPRVLDVPSLDVAPLDVPSRGTPPGRAAEVRADLAVPSARTLAAALCGGPSRDSTGALIGRVLDAATGGPLVGAVVTVRWGEVRVDARGVRRVIQGVREAAGEGGRFAACGVPADVPVSVQARVEPAAGAGAGATRGAASGAIEVSLDAATPLRYRDLLVDPLAGAEPGAPPPTPESGEPLSSSGSVPARRRGRARLAGRVLRPDGQPLEGARVMVRGTGFGDSLAVTTADGRYHLDGLPAGTHPVEVVALGYTPARGAADLRPGAVATFDVTVGKRVNTLQSVSVYAAAPRATTEFARRRRLGIGHFLTGDDVARRHPSFLGDALVSVPGLRMAGTTPTGRPILRGRFNCAPAFYLDGFRVEGGSAEVDSWVRVSDVAGVEMYGNSLEAPVQYRNFGCATVLVWTKGALR